MPLSLLNLTTISFLPVGVKPAEQFEGYENPAAEFISRNSSPQTDSAGVREVNELPSGSSGSRTDGKTILIKSAMRREDGNCRTMGAGTPGTIVARPTNPDAVGGFVIRRIPIGSGAPAKEGRQQML